MFTKTLLALAGIFVLSITAYSQTKLLRFPDIRGDRVVFTYAGDLWTAPSSGGSALRLTSHPGVEVFGKFSPDGKWIAFTGQYDGDEQVYVVPTSGGEPRQLTFYPAHGPLAPRWGWDNQVFGWTKDSKRIIFSSNHKNPRGPGASNFDLFLINLDGTGLEQVTTNSTFDGFPMFSPDGRTLAASGDIKPEVVRDAIQRYGLDPEGVDPRVA